MTESAIQTELGMGKAEQSRKSEGTIMGSDHWEAIVLPGVCLTAGSNWFRVSQE